MGDSAASKKQINLLRGWPNASLLPTSAIATAAQSALSDPSISTPGLSYGPDPGYQPLREEIASWLSEFYRSSSNSPTPTKGSPADLADPERICISGGASQNLACALQVFTDPLYTQVWMVAPCYFLACRIFEDAGLKTRAIAEGKEGVDLVGLETGLQAREREEGIRMKLKQPKPWARIYKHIIYCVPTYSNPSGNSMSLSHRQSLVRLARKYDALIVTDDVYDFLQWPISKQSLSKAPSLSKALLPRLVDIDRTLEPIPDPNSFGNAMSNGSFSKIAGPGVRTGWAEATPTFTYGLSQCGSSRSGGAPSQLTATIICEVLKSGSLQKHIESVLKPAYQKRYEIMIQAIKTHLVPLGVRVEEDSLEGKEVYGGYFIWIELPAGVDADTVARRAEVEENLIIAPGGIFEVQQDTHVRFPGSARLCFAWVEEEDLEEGIERLANVVRSVLSGVGGNAVVDGKPSQKDFGAFQ